MTRTVTTGELRGGRTGDAELGEMSDGGLGNVGRCLSSGMDGLSITEALDGFKGCLDDLDGWESDGFDGPVTSCTSRCAAIRSVVLEAAGFSSGRFTFRMGEPGGTGMLGKRIGCTG